MIYDVSQRAQLSFMVLYLGSRKGLSLFSVFLVPLFGFACVSSLFKAVFVNHCAVPHYIVHRAIMSGVSCKTHHLIGLKKI